MQMVVPPEYSHLLGVNDLRLFRPKDIMAELPANLPAFPFLDRSFCEPLGECHNGRRPQAASKTLASFGVSRFLPYWDCQLHGTRQ